MRYVIGVFVLFCVQLSAKGEAPVSETIPVKKWDTVKYPTDAEPVVVEALINGLFYHCTVVPGDSFEITKISDHSDGSSQIVITKTEGTPGDQEICHIGSSIYHITGTYKIIKTKDGLPQNITQMFYPFVFEPDNLEDAQSRKSHEKMEDTPSTVKTVRFREDDMIVYPLDAEPVAIDISMNRLNFNCVVVPGDSFKVTNIVNYSFGGTEISFRKTGGTPGDQDVCPLNSWIPTRIEECKLIRTEEGIPEAVNCRLSLENLFRTKEKEEVQEEVQEKEGILSRILNLIS